MSTKDTARSGLSPDLRESISEGRDPASTAVRLALVVYLSPVILLVAALGGLAIASGKLIETLAALLNRAGRSSRPAFSKMTTRGSVIGSRPLTRQWGSTRPRVIR